MIGETVVKNKEREDRSETNEGLTHIQVTPHTHDNVISVSSVARSAWDYINIRNVYLKLNYQPKHICRFSKKVRCSR